MRLGGFHWNQRYSTEKEAFGLLLSRNPWFQWNHPTSFSVKALGFNETTRPPPQSKPFVSMKPPFVSISEPPKNRETADILLKFHWNRQKKIVSFPFKTTCLYLQTCFEATWSKFTILNSKYHPMKQVGPGHGNNPHAL